MCCRQRGRTCALAVVVETRVPSLYTGLVVAPKTFARFFTGLVLALVTFIGHCSTLPASADLRAPQTFPHDRTKTIVDSLGPLCQWGTLTDEQLRLDSSYSGLQLAGAQYYDSTTGKWVDRAPTPKNSYGPVHIGDAIIGTEGGIVNALWKSVAAPIVDQMLKAKGITQLNAKQQALLDRGLNLYKIDQSNPIQRGFAISGEGVSFMMTARIGVRGVGLGSSRQIGGTYALVTKSGSVVRTGRTSNLVRRAYEHRRTFGDTLEFVRDLESSSPWTRSLREQRISDKFRPILNKRDPIGRLNPLRRIYEGLERTGRLPGGRLGS